MLTDDEILDAINEAPLAQGPQTFVLSIGRAIERKVLAKQSGTTGYMQRLSSAAAGAAEYASWSSVEGTHGVAIPGEGQQ